MIVYGKGSINSDEKTDTIFFEQKTYLRTKILENETEEDIDLKCQFRTKNIPDPISIMKQLQKLILILCLTIHQK